MIAYASAGDFVRFNPHLHGIFLEGGFDRKGRFVHVPSVDLQRLAQYFRASMVDQRLARSMLDWTHSGFSLDMSVKIPTSFCPRTREALAQYIPGPQQVVDLRERPPSGLPEQDARGRTRGKRPVPLRVQSVFQDELPTVPRHGVPRPTPAAPA